MNYCLYAPRDTDCNDIIRGEDGDVSGADPYQSWFDLGDNIGLTNTFVDTNIVDGIDYTYTITAYDRGLKPIVREFGSYDDLSGEWAVIEDHTFREVIPAKEYILNRLNYTIINSEIGDNVYVYILEIPNSHV